MVLGPVFQLVVVDMEVSEEVQQSEEVEVVPGFQDLRVKSGNKLKKLY